VQSEDELGYAEVLEGSALVQGCKGGCYDYERWGSDSGERQEDEREESAESEEENLGKESRASMKGKEMMLGSKSVREPI
jgi:hypothetical protein